MKLLSIILLFIVMQFNCKAQDLYSGFNGTIRISTNINGKAVSFRSDDLEVRLDYQNAEIEFVVDKSTLKEYRTGKMFVHKYSETSPKIKYKGNLNLDYIKTENHPTLTVIDEGYFICDKTDTRFYVIGNGFLTHISSTGYNACILSLTYLFSTASEECSIIGEDNSSDIKIEIIHSVLNEKLIDKYE